MDEWKAVHHHDPKRTNCVSNKHLPPPHFLTPLHQLILGNDSLLHEELYEGRDFNHIRDDYFIGVTICFGSSGSAVSTNDLLSLIERIQLPHDMVVSRKNPNESVLFLREVDTLSSYM